MTNLSSIDRSLKLTPQLPVSWYFDEAIYEIEKRILFDNGPGYVGHELMTPNSGDYYVLNWLNDAWALINKPGGGELISNICRHRQALLLEGKGQVTHNNIICPLHRWTYDLDGKLIGAPDFSTNPCLHLPTQSLQKWNGMLFSGKWDVAKDLEKFAGVKGLDFSGHALSKVTISEYDSNWKAFIEVYLDNYHVGIFHPGLGNFVDTTQITADYGHRYQLHSVPVNRGLTRPGTKIYKHWHEVLMNYRKGEEPPYGAVWLTYYPNVMVECYPHTIVVSTVVPRGPEKCLNVMEYYYPEEIALFESEFVEAEQQAYAETAREDDEILRRITAGRRALWLEGRNEWGPYQMPLEEGMKHFHEFIRCEVGPHVKK